MTDPRVGEAPLWYWVLNSFIRSLVLRHFLIKECNLVCLLPLRHSWRKGLGRGGRFSWDSPLLDPLPAPRSRGEEEEGAAVGAVPRSGISLFSSERNSYGVVAR